MNILIVGLGSMGKRRARLIKGMDAAHRLTGVDSTSSRRLEAEGLGITTFASIDEALQAGSYEAAFVCTAPLSHGAIIHQLLDANLPVFTELNLVADEYEALEAKAKEKNLPLFVSSTMLYRGETSYIAKQVEEFGKPVSYTYHIGQYLPDWHPWESYKNFFVGDARTSGVREILAIDLPWLVEAFGPVERMHVEKAKMSSLDIAYEDTCYILLRHKNGTLGSLVVDVVSPKAVRNFEVFGEGLHVFWEGNPKSLYRYDVICKDKVLVDTYTEFEQDERYSDNIVENAYVDEIANFFAVLVKDEAPRWSLQKDKAVLNLIDRVEQAGGQAT